MEEAVGFEPTLPFGTPDFESGTFGHSATTPDIASIGRSEDSIRASAPLGHPNRVAELPAP